MDHAENSHFLLRFSIISQAEDRVHFHRTYVEELDSNLPRRLPALGLG